MSETNSIGGEPRNGRGTKIALAISLALNLAIVGLVAGAVLGRGGSGGHGGSPALRSLGLGPFVMALSHGDRTELRDRIAGRSAPLREERRAIGRSLRVVQEALLADPFDRATAEAAFESSRGRVLSLQEAGHTALLDQIETMTMAERVELAEQLTRAMGRLGRRR
ncbi:MAG TPA: periplasmic heavy metal sensor [Roseibacterium sp.]|nr:periplasmic heavy metal sensor [Roseibacterium sp.]